MGCDSIDSVRYQIEIAPMKIGIDARLIEETGVGRYIRNLIVQLGILDKKNTYVVFLRRSGFHQFISPNNRWERRVADIGWHSVSEQFMMPKLFEKERLDLVHIPYHNPPIFYEEKMVVTIHDLTIVHFDTGRATTLPIPLYKLKRLGYWLELTLALRKARKIITVSNATKQEIMDHFGVGEDKIIVTYEAVDSEIVRLAQESKRPLVSEPYILYVGNAYPHKNLDMLLSAWQGKLVLATPDDYFSKRLNVGKNVLMFRGASALQLANLYAFAQALVFPSLMEGFGLPGIEAMAVGIPVVCSDIPVFREIYGEASLMFDPRDPVDIAAKLREVLRNENLRRDLIAKGKKQTAKYSWRRMAEQTLDVYEHIGKNL